MLILAGVSINAIVGDDGILSRTQYSTFLSEMTAVEEAVQMWKAGEVLGAKGEETKTIPVNGLCSINDLTSTERLVGEVGYYRIWSMTENVPTTSVLSSTSDFNNVFESELIFYPAGVQDLYYLNNKVLGIKSDKTYVIDAATGMIYSMKGITLKGVSCYSANMATAVMSGNLNAPIFAEAEVSGTGADEKLAGNTGPEYFEDGSKNENYHPYGFKIIANETSNNIYKLYNNGDLYAKGVKGTQLLSSISTMEGIDSSKFSEFTVPSNLSSYKKLFIGAGTMYVIDSNDDLWAWGNNANNKLGLNYNELIEYTERDLVKLNVANGKKISKIFDIGGNLFVVTLDNELYVMGFNWSRDGFGLYLNQTQDAVLTEFTKINEIPDPSKINEIYLESSYAIIECSDNTYYGIGSAIKRFIGNGSTGGYKKFMPIFNGYTYKEDVNGNYIIDENFGYQSELDIDSDIKQIARYGYTIFILKNNDTNLWHVGDINSYTAVPDGKLNYLTCISSSEYGTNVKNIYSTSYGFIIEKNNGEIYGGDGLSDCMGFGTPSSVIKKITLNAQLEQEGIKEIFVASSAVYYLSNTGNLYGTASSGTFLGLGYVPNKMVKIDAPKMTSLYNLNNITNKVKIGNSNRVASNIIFQGADNKLYTINNSVIAFRNNILQQNWNKIAGNVKDVALGNNESIAYIDRNLDLYVAGNDSRMLAQNTEKQNPIREFTKVDDSNINNKVKEVKFAYDTMYVLTTDKKLYATGLYSLNGSLGWPNDRTPGWPENENKYTLVEILSDVDVFHAQNYNKAAVVGNKLYLWGMNADNELNLGNRGIKVPTLKDLSIIYNITTTKKLIPSIDCSSIITNDGKFIACGSNASTHGALSFGNNKWEDISNWFNGEKVVDFVTMNRSAGIALTENGNVYGWGQQNYLGMNVTESSLIKQAEKLPIENVVQIVAGNGFFICVKDDGSVWGTGLNTYGVLGRWIGIDRKQPNSRYKTAFEWVECPELEI